MRKRHAYGLGRFGEAVKAVFALRAYLSVRKLARRLLVLASVFAGAIPASSLQNGVDAYTSGNYPEAVLQFRPLAETGDPQAQFNMGVLAFKGHGLARDLVESYAWLTVSGRQGFAFACRYRERVGARLTPQQIQLAQERARQRLQQGTHAVASAGHPSDEDWCPEQSLD